MQALIVLALIVAAGLGLGKIHFKGISLGVTWVLPYKLILNFNTYLTLSDF